MSLKAFHIVFISVSVLLALWFGGWLVGSYMETGNLWQLVFAILSFGTAVGLVLYERYFLKKTKHISYL